jgi:hypothetical protein
MGWGGKIRGQSNVVFQEGTECNASNEEWDIERTIYSVEVVRSEPAIRILAIFKNVK